MTLHIIRSQTAFERAHDALSDADAVLLIEAGVLLARNITIKCYALKEDLLARGIVNNISDAVEQTDYAGFVELSEKNNKIITW